MLKEKLTGRIAVIGAGIMGADHAEIISKDIPGATLQVICDLSEDRAREVAKRIGAEHVASDAGAAIRRGDVDAVVIASPDETHAGLAQVALELRKPVLCEKPLAVSAREALSIVEAEVHLGRQLIQVGFMRRFDPSYADMKAGLASGQIGQAIMMHNFHRNVAAPANFSGLMAITNSAPHEFDAIRYILDTEITAISAFEQQ